MDETCAGERKSGYVTATWRDGRNVETALVDVERSDVDSQINRSHEYVAGWDPRLPAMKRCWRIIALREWPI